MKARSIIASEAGLNRDPAASVASSRVTLLPGFIRHIQQARRIEHQSQCLYATSDADLQIAPEEIAAQLADLYSR